MDYELRDNYIKKRLKDMKKQQKQMNPIEEITKLIKEKEESNKKTADVLKKIEAVLKEAKFIERAVIVMENDDSGILSRRFEFGKDEKRSTAIGLLEIAKQRFL